MRALAVVLAVAAALAIGPPTLAVAAPALGTPTILSSAATSAISIIGVVTALLVLSISLTTADQRRRPRSWLERAAQSAYDAIELLVTARKEVGLLSSSGRG